MRLESGGDHTVTSVPTWEFYGLGPGRYEQILSEYDVVVFSDVEAEELPARPEFLRPDEVRKAPSDLPGPGAAHGRGAAVGRAHDVSRRLAELQRGGGKRRLGPHPVARDPPGGVPAVGGSPREHGGMAWSGRPGRPPRAGGTGPGADAARSWATTSSFPREGCDVVAVWENTNDPMIAVGTVWARTRACVHIRPRAALGLQLRVLGSIPAALAQRGQLALGARLAPDQSGPRRLDTVRASRFRAA